MVLDDLGGDGLSGEVTDHVNSAYSEAASMTTGHAGAKGRHRLPSRRSNHARRDGSALSINHGYLGSIVDGST